MIICARLFQLRSRLSSGLMVARCDVLFLAVLPRIMLLLTRNETRGSIDTLCLVRRILGFTKNKVFNRLSCCHELLMLSVASRAVQTRLVAPAGSPQGISTSLRGYLASRMKPAAAVRAK
jgi:hypothetical protein